MGIVSIITIVLVVLLLVVSVLLYKVIYKRGFESGVEYTIREWRKAHPEYPVDTVGNLIYLSDYRYYDYE